MAIVAFSKFGDSRPELLQVAVDAAVGRLLIERAVEALDDTVGLRLGRESEAGRDATELDRLEEVVGVYFVPWSIRRVSPRPASAPAAPNSACKP